MATANTTYFFSTTVAASDNSEGFSGVEYVFQPNQLDPDMPVVNEFSNVLCAAAEVDQDGNPFQGHAAIAVLNTFCTSDPDGSGSVHVLLKAAWPNDINVRLAFVLWP